MIQSKREERGEGEKRGREGERRGRERGEGGREGRWDESKIKSIIIIFKGHQSKTYSLHLMLWRDILSYFVCINLKLCITS